MQQKRLRRKARGGKNGRKKNAFYTTYQWRLDGLSKADAGTGLHLSIELFLNNAPRPDTSEEFKQFEAWQKQEKPPTWEPYRTEWSVFNEDADLAGQIDSLWIDVSDGSYHMVDWKRVYQLERSNNFGEKGFAPFQLLPNTNLYHYYVQQNLYAWLLRSKYGISVKSMWLLQLHETNDNYVAFEVPALIPQTDLLMKRRINAIQFVAASAEDADTNAADAHNDGDDDKHHLSKKQKTNIYEDIKANETRIAYYKEIIACLEVENARHRRALRALG